ncbi:INO80 complex subunit B [Scaptodrosophila lebanonensis]|uniref:INO80 complex subunit B n=1 Tax=Drosophila lebanonensis TaxID=7225 RepID=A0A6J2UF22_DROLE|nr:INO80 complex subunit B [Scaptodrosophila lebanonensis]
MGKTEDRRSKRSKRQKPARFATDSPTPSVKNDVVEVVEPSTPTPLPQPPLQTASPVTPIKKGNILEFPSLRTRPTPASASNKKPQQTSTSPNAAAKKPKKRRNSDTSSDEERWLNAIETGKLDDVDEELKKIKDPKLMTARQRAMYERSQDAEPALAGFVEELIALPSGYREKEKPQTAEEIQKAALKSQKRKQQADERREKDKQKTMERLLKKQESGKQRIAARNKQSQKPAFPTLTYKNTLEGAYIIVPPHHEFPLQAQTARTPPPVQLCGVAGCGNRKAYSCSKTNVALCSLICYKKNLALVQ